MKHDRISVVSRATFTAGLVGATALMRQPARADTAGTPLIIGTSSDFNNGGLVIVAKGMDFFKNHGLDVTLKYFPSGGDLVSAIASGALFVGVGGVVPSTTLRASGFPVVVLAQQADISGSQIVVVNKDIAAPQNLEGKKLGALFGTVSQMLADAMLANYHIPSDKVTIVNLGPADMVTALIRGDISGACLWEPWVSQAVKGGAKRLLSGTISYVPGHVGPATLIGDHALLIAPQPWVGKNGTTVDAVLRALIEANKFVATDPGKSAEIVGKELQMAPADVKTLMANNKYSMVIDAKLIRDMNGEAAFLSGAGKLKSPVKAAEWVFTEPLRRVAPNMVTWSA